jgi:hemerythrin-like metal-binding protein
MPLFIWKNKYSVGIKAMDDQHSHFMGLVNDFHAAAMKGKARSVAGPSLHKVADYSRHHFSAEEALMEEHKYPELAEHQAIHKELARQAGGLMERFEKGVRSVNIETLKHLRDGFANHILVEDMKYGVWIKEQGTS